MERAFRFLKRTSVNGGAVGAEGELLGAAKGGVVLSGEVAGEMAGDGFIRGDAAGPPVPTQEMPSKLKERERKVGELSYR